MLKNISVIVLGVLTITFGIISMVLELEGLKNMVRIPGADSFIFLALLMIVAIIVIGIINQVGINKAKKDSKANAEKQTKE